MKLLVSSEDADIHTNQAGTYRELRCLSCSAKSAANLLASTLEAMHAVPLRFERLLARSTEMVLSLKSVLRCLSSPLWKSDKDAVAAMQCVWCTIHIVE